MILEDARRRAGLTGTSSIDLGSCVAGLVNTLVKGAAAVLAPYGLLPLDFSVLKLFLHKEQWTVAQLAQALPVKTPRISRVVTSLVDRGLVRRRRPTNAAVSCS